MKVAESLQEDIDKGIARISSKDLKAMNLIPGDIVQLKGKKVFGSKKFLGPLEERVQLERFGWMEMLEVMLE